VFFVLAALDLTSLSTAFTLAKWTGLGLIFAYGFLGSRLAGTSVATALAHAGAIGAVGGLLIAFKSLLH
jgi:hypothetical protein